MRHGIARFGKTVARQLSAAPGYARRVFVGPVLHAPDANGAGLPDHASEVGSSLQPAESGDGIESAGAGASALLPDGRSTEAVLREEVPLRAELFSIDQLEQHAKALAGWHDVDLHRGSDRLLPRLDENEKVLLHAYELVTAAVTRNRRIAPAAEWLIDNFYLIEEQIRTARRHLPRGYSRELPRLLNGANAGYPRVYDIALELIAHVDGRVDAENLSGFVAAYQSIAMLKIGELWAVPIMLRLALLENLRRVSARVAAGRTDRDRANFWADRLADMAEKDPKNLVLILADMVRTNPPLTSAFVAELARRLQGQTPALALPMSWVDQRLAENGATVEQLVQIESQNQAADQVSIGNSIGSLRFLAAMDWREFVETMSSVEHTLRGDPADVYSDMDFGTRDRYRHAVERLARRSRLSEEDVAAEAIRLARETKRATGSDDASARIRAAHVGYYLIDRGRATLERAVRARATPGDLLARLGRRYPLTVYAGGIILLTVLIVAVTVALARGLGTAAFPITPAWVLVLLAVPLLLSASHLAVSVVNWLSTLLVAPRPLPRLDFSLGIPPECRTMVVVPTMLTSAAAVEELLESLEVRYLANRDEHLHFALLTDFRDSAQEHMPGDDTLIKLAREGIELLNHKYSAERAARSGDEATLDAGADLFYLFHRPRRWNEVEGCWMGWERKRGKLAEFNHLLRSSDSSAHDAFSIIVGDTGLLQTVRYVITLDTDTQLPRDAARGLVGTIAHPLNRSVFDERRGRVIDGYSILQPRVAVSLPSAGRSWFVRLFAGDPGIDPYTRTVSDVYQDLFGEGSFIGKGIYDVDAFERAVGRRFPENRILSHDLLEGAHARAALVSDVQLFEEHPSRYTADVSRRHRWIRGDWQISAWLLPQVPGPGGSASFALASNPISGLSRWKILDNLRRSLVPIGVVLMLLLAWTLPGAALLFTLVALAVMFLVPMLQGMTAAARRPGDLPWGMHLGAVAASTGRQIAQAVCVLVFLPYEAYISADAVVRTAARLCFTRRKLLEWQTASDAERHAKTALAGFITSMWIGLALGVVAMAVVLLLHREAALIAAPVAALWIASPALAWWLSRPLAPREARLSDHQRFFLRKLARRTWRFFDHFVGPVDNYLPPDNYQEHPSDVVAHRTSPTNIGMALLANLSACDFGYVSPGRLIDRTARTLGTLEKLDRYRGHYYNWYDTRTLAPLPPLYVSSVDSGNLAGHLLVLRQGLLELERQPVLPKRLFGGLEDTISLVQELLRAPERPRMALPSDLLARLERLRGECAVPPHTLAASHMLLQRAASLATELAVGCRNLAADGELLYWAEAFERQARDQLDDLTHVVPWIVLPAPGDRMWRRGSQQQMTRLGALRDVLRTLDDIPELGALPMMRERILPAIDAIVADLRGPATRIDQHSADGPASPDGERHRALSESEDDEWFTALRHRIVEAADRAEARLTDAAALAARCESIADMDWSFLFDRSRDLLSIGYNVSDNRLDASFYDLLASEARLGSFIAIAQGKLPQDHWFSLGRLLTNSAGREPALLSWSGSMFEYLMPLLVMPTYEQTLLDQTYRAVIRRQVEYGRERGVPWGVSESGYHTTDAQLNYQYRAFGVPGLGFKRGLAEDLVIAPYASVMGLMVEPEHAVENLERLAQLGQIGPYGFYEAIDYTAARVPRGQAFATVRSWMAHHQGMSLLSLEYLLLDRPMQRRFDADPLFKATDLLLQERVPKAAPVFPHAAEVAGARRGADTDATLRIFSTANTPVPEVHLLSNGRYHVMVTAAGGGYSRWRDLAVTRWREDTTRDDRGTFVYLRDLTPGSAGGVGASLNQPVLGIGASGLITSTSGVGTAGTTEGDFWSATHQPTLRPARAYQAIFPQARAEFRRRDGDIESYTEIAVSPEDDVELRRVTLTNRGRARRTIEVTSYAEVVIAPPAADSAHMTFSNLFVQTQIIRNRSAILCTRRPRSAGERPPFMLHLMTVHGGSATSEASFETDRSKFIGRGCTPAAPAALRADVRALGDSEGSVLDPIVAVRRTVVIEPGETARIDIVTGMTETRDAALGLIERYHDRRLSDRVFELSWTHSQVVLRQLNATEDKAQLYGRLASSVLFASAFRRAAPGIISRNRRGQSGLWGYGISGDLPIVLLRVADQARVELVRQLVQAHAYWRTKGLAVDLVIWNEDPSGYRQQLQDAIMGMIAAGTEAQTIDRPGGIFVRRADQIAEDDKVLMQAVARVILTDTAGTLEEQIEKRAGGAAPAGGAAAPRFVPTRPRRGAGGIGAGGSGDIPVAVELLDRDLIFFNGHGGFTRDGREYVITSPDAASVTPAPWCNVIANAHGFGTVVSESGGAYTWADNAHEFRLTTWYNDPVSDTTGECFYLRDEETGRYWSPSPLPARGAMPYTTRHGFGYSVYEYSENGLHSEMWSYVATDAPVKFVAIRLRNTSGRPRRLSVSGFVEWVLGEVRAKTVPQVVTELDAKTGAIFARNTYSNEFAERVAFFDCSETTRSITGDRTEFIGRNGSPSAPAAMSRARLAGRVGAGFDPCAAMQTVIELAEGQEREVVFTLGAGRDATDARALVQRFRGAGNARRALEAVWQYWNHTLGVIHVQTPDPALDLLANGWLTYQVLACRHWARSGFYQSGGAYGFRDQLQDVCALLYAEPRLFREHLLRCAARQFKQGDVQHWWHPPIGRGVRTHFSDDYLWLPLATCRYVMSTGDTGVLDEKIAFLEGRPVNPDEESYYDLPGRSEETGTLYEHCVRAIRNGLRFGDLGLPLMGCGDWNDGMNLVGEHGKGQSVWLGFFLLSILNDFGELARQRGDTAFAQTCREQAADLRRNIEGNAWDGEWYRRAYFDNGEPLGSASNPECQIDALPQSWAVLSGAGDPARAKQAMAAVNDRLVKRDAGLIQLFDPPFDSSHLNPGYIKGYVPGVRENGGQYTHAAIWTVMAFAALGDVERAWELFQLINPVGHGDSAKKIARYKVEPYVVAADVYAVPPHTGRGGWTWYTGSAGWMYRLIIESLLGLRLEVDKLKFEPLVPPAWKSFTIHYRYRETFHHIVVNIDGPGRTVKRVMLDGKEQPDKSVPLTDDRREHNAEVFIG